MDFIFDANAVLVLNWFTVMSEYAIAYAFYCNCFIYILLHLITSVQHAFAI